MIGNTQTAGLVGTGLLGWLEQAKVRAVLVLLLCGLLLFLPGFFSIPPLDRDEARFAQASKQMVETGNFVDIRFQDTPRYLKPIGIYWLQSGAALLSGLGAEAPIWVYRIPSLLGALASVLLCYWTALALGPPRAAFIAGVLFSAIVVLGIEARMATTDAVLLASILAAQGALARLFLQPVAEGARRWRLIFWAALGASILIKGPVGPMVAGLTLIGLCVGRRSLAPISALRPVSGFALMAAIVLPWVIAISVISGGEFFQAAIGGDFLAKIGQGQESHGAPPGTHLVSALVVHWPLTPFLFLALPWVWRNWRAEPVLFCLAWLVPAWLVFEIVATKLPHYTLPLIAAGAILVALAAEHGAARVRAWWQEVGLASGPLVALAIAGAAFFVPQHIEGEVFIVGGLAMVAMFWISLAAWWRARRDDFPGAVALSVGAALVYAWAGYGLIAPNLSNLWVSPRLAAALAQARPDCAATQAASVGYHEPSLVFLAGTELRLTDAPGAAAFLADGDCRAVAVETREEPEFLHHAANAGVQPKLTRQVTGIALNGAKPVYLGVYVRGREGQ